METCPFEIYCTQDCLSSYSKTVSNAHYNFMWQVFVTSGLGGMSGAQAKAAVICGCVGVIAEVKYLLSNTIGLQGHLLI